MSNHTNVVRISATVPAELAAYLEHYQQAHGLETRSQALAQAIAALQQLEMLRGYEEIGLAERHGELLHDDLENVDGLEPETVTWR